MSPERETQPRLKIKRRYKYGELPRDQVPIRWEIQLPFKQIIEIINQHNRAELETDNPNPLILSQQTEGPYYNSFQFLTPTTNNRITLDFKTIPSGKTTIEITVSHHLWQTNKYSVDTLSRLVQQLFG